jgi:hypothetical protein
MENLNILYSNLTQYEQDLIRKNLVALTSTKIVKTNINVQTRSGDEDMTKKTVVDVISDYQTPEDFPQGYLDSLNVADFGEVPRV